MRPRFAALLGLCTGAALAGCGDQFPTSPDPGRLPFDPVTVEVVLPFSEFATEARVLEGFGAPIDLSTALVALDLGGDLEIRTLTRFAPFPTSAQVRTPEGVTVTDSTLTFVGGRVVARTDTIDRPDRPVTIRAGLTTAPWDARTVTWELAVDTLDERTPWPVPGGGPVIDLGTDVLDPPAEDPDDGDDGDDGGDDGDDDGGEAPPPDSVVFELDSSQVARLGDVDDPTRGVRLEMETSGERVRFRQVELLLTTRPSVHPDTLITLSVSRQNLTFVYDPPQPPGAGLRVGGVPASRTVLVLDFPEELDGPPALCQRVGCPVRIQPDQVNAAFLELTSREVPLGFQPADSVFLDVRPVLAPELLPKSPLGASVAPTGGVRMGPALFADDAGSGVAVPLTSYVRDLVRGETSDGRPVPSTLSILALPEPSSFGFASFVEPGAEGEPLLRLILTFGDEVTHP